MPEKYSIQVEDLSKTYGRKYRRGEYSTIKQALTRMFRAPDKQGTVSHPPALQGISFNVNPGQFMGVVGKNGSGKSTLLKLLAGVLKPDTGNVRVNGRVAALLELGAGFHPEFSGRENIFINAAIFGLSRQEIKTKFDEIVEFSELAGYIDEPVRTYSSGMYMRLAFSVATHVDADVLLIDEVLAVGDTRFVQKCEERMRQFRQQGKTIILVTHDMGAVEKWCDSALLLSGGHLVLQDTPQKVIERYMEEMEILPEGVSASDLTHLDQTMQFKAVPGDRSVSLSWINPPMKDFLAVKILRRNDRYPQHREDGYPVYWYNGNTCIDGNLDNQVPCYYAAFAHDKYFHFLPSVCAEATPDKQENPVTVMEPQVTRWGSRDVVIDSVQMISGGNDIAQVPIKSGDPVRIIINYSIKSKLTQRPIFGFGLFRADGLECWGTNTDLDKVEYSDIPETGIVSVEISRLALLPGNYWLNVATHDPDHRPFDYWTRALTFSVISDHRDAGVFWEQHQWMINPGTDKK